MGEYSNFTRAFHGPLARFHLHPFHPSSLLLVHFTLALNTVHFDPFCIKHPQLGVTRTPSLFLFGCFQNSGTPKSSILIGFSIINHPFWGTTILGTTHFPEAKSGSDQTRKPFLNSVVFPGNSGNSCPKFFEPKFR